MKLSVVAKLLPQPAWAAKPLHKPGFVQAALRWLSTGSALKGPVETETLRLLGALTRETTRRAGTLMVREDSHKQHEKFWGEVSGMSEADKAANGDFYMFKPEVP